MRMAQALKLVHSEPHHRQGFPLCRQAQASQQLSRDHQSLHWSALPAPAATRLSLRPSTMWLCILPFDDAASGATCSHVSLHRCALACYAVADTTSTLEGLQEDMATQLLQGPGRGWWLQECGYGSILVITKYMTSRRPPSCILVFAAVHTFPLIVEDTAS